MATRRVDARRNEQALLDAAAAAFVASGVEAPVRDIAARAGVGVGTVYRHFPTRADLVQAIYVDEVEALSRSATELSQLEPWEALEGWLHRFVGYIATKQALADELFAVAERDAVFAGCRTMLHAAGTPLLHRAQEAGIVRPDVTIDEVIRLVGGIAKIPAEPAEIQRLLAVALDGLRYRP